MIARLVSRRALSNVTISDRIATVTLANPPVNLLSRSGSDIKVFQIYISLSKFTFKFIFINFFQYFVNI